MAHLLHHLLTESAAQHPNREAVVHKNDRITYAGLERESTMLASVLAKAGIARGDRVGIYLDRSIAAITGIFGILKAGAAYVPIDPHCPAGRLGYILDKAKLKALLTSREGLKNLEPAVSGSVPLETVLVMNPPGDVSDSGPRSIGGAAVGEWQELRGAAGTQAPDAYTIDRDLAYILFTSGSTGIPKGVMLTHANALTFVNAAHDLFHPRPEDRFSNVCPLHFDMSVFDLFVAFKAGATVVVIPDTTAMFPVRLAEAIEKNGITIWNSVPSALSLLATHKTLDRHDLSRLRLVLFAGEVFPHKYLERLRKALPGAQFCNMYGQTEANTSTWYLVEPLPAAAPSPLPIGRALPNFEVFALDDEGRQITLPGQEGELYVRSSSVAQGYWGEPERTELSFVQDPRRPDRSERVYRTGDLVRLDPGGAFLFAGRADHMIKSRGYKIEIGEIETALRNHPDIKNAAVLAVPDELVGNRIVAIVVPAGTGAAPGKEDVLNYCAQHLPRYMIPEFVEFSQTLPMTSSGKIDRRKLTTGRDVASLVRTRQVH